MILLDTNVVSEVMRTHPAAAVIDWLNDSDTASLYLSAVVIAEIAYGISSLPIGQRRDGLRGRFAAFVERGFSTRVLAFDETAAYLCGDLIARRRALGRPMSVPDGQLAAIATAHRFAIATRDTAGFEGLGLDLIDPWTTD